MKDDEGVDSEEDEENCWRTGSFVQHAQRIGPFSAMTMARRVHQARPTRHDDEAGAADEYALFICHSHA